MSAPNTPNNYEYLWRPAFEFNQSLAWFSGAFASYLIGINVGFPMRVADFAVIGLVAVGSFRLYEAFNVWKQQDALQHTPIRWKCSSSLARYAAKHGATNMWMGTGFEWKPIHAQRAYQLTKMNVRDIKISFLFRVYGILTPTIMNKSGSPWIHGLELNHIPITPKRKNHTLCLGITGAGKTRLAEVMITQAIHAGDVVIYIDPKGDKEIRDRMLYEAIQAGREKDFAYFSPAHPSESVLFDPLKNWSRPTQIATRVAALLPSQQGGSDTFVAFAWRALDLIAQGLIETEEAPNLTLLRRYIEGGSDGLVEQAIYYFLQSRDMEKIEASITPYLTRVRKQQNLKPQSSTPDRAHALVLYYQENIIESERSDIIDGLINMYSHSREHFQKMITSLIPTLNMLTSGDLRSLLSPDYLNMDEQREILDSARVMSRSKIIYLGLDSLADGTIGSAIGSIILSDLTSVAADIYNHQDEEKRKRLSIFIDEAAEVVNAPTVQLLNKSRSANFYITLLSQTIPDFIARTGDEAMARQILGNCGNLVALRSTDIQTQEYCVESFGKTTVKQQMHTQSTNPIQNKDLTDWSGGTGERLVEAEYDLFNASLLGRLPDLHYISTFDGGNIYKGTLPLLTKDKDWNFKDHWPPKKIN